LEDFAFVNIWQNKLAHFNLAIIVGVGFITALMLLFKNSGSLAAVEGIAKRPRNTQANH
jgi:uncharacterized membrane protein